MAKIECGVLGSNTELIPAGTDAIWGGVRARLDALIQFLGTTKPKPIPEYRLLVYFLLPDSPVPTLKYDSKLKVGLCFVPSADFSKWSGLALSGKRMKFTLETSGTHYGQHKLEVASN